MNTRRKSHWLRRALVAVVGLAGAGLGGWYATQPREEGSAYQTADVVRDDLAQVVTATGQLDPVTQVEVGSQISGCIQKLYVDFNSTVTNTQVIAEIDPATYEAALIQAEGTLANAKAALELAQLEEARARELRANKLNTQSDYDTALANLHKAQADVRVNEGLYKKAQVDLSRCTIRSPIDGIVISRNVNVGQTVAASLSAPTLFVIANDLTRMRIEAQVAEADIGNVEVGQDARFTVDALPGQTFLGKTIQIRNTPTIDQNVVSYDTVIEAANPNLKLKPGMTANVGIIVARRHSVLKIPVEALRFRPPATAQLEPGEPAVEPAGPPAKGAPASAAPGRKKEKRKTGTLVYVLAGKDPAGAGEERLRPAQVKTGISDGNYTEIVAGVNEGDQIVIGASAPKAPSLRVAGIFSSAGKKR